MTLQELRYLVALANHGHFARAAEACNISQSTLSVQIKKLEDYLGVTLFDRSLRQVATSPVAREIVALARSIVIEADRIRALGRDQPRQDPMAGTIQLGVIPTLAPYLMPRVLPALHRLFPRLRLLLREAFTHVLLDQLGSGAIDAALVALPDAARSRKAASRLALPLERFESEALFDEPFVAALPAAHPLAARARVRPEELADAPLLLLEEGHCLRAQALDLCDRPASGLAEEIRGTSLETLRQMVSLGVGCTVMPALAVAATAAAKSITYRPFTGPQPTRSIGLVWRRHSPHDAALRMLAEALRVHAPSGVQRAGEGGRAGGRARPARNRRA
jgi:LysR family transcriptional regulator, hydrogen peroxide-inducible genes activator